jgi:hypothetical protein
MALQLKLDEIIIALVNARNELVELTDHELERKTEEEKSKPVSSQVRQAIRDLPPKAFPHISMRLSSDVTRAPAGRPFKPPRPRCLPSRRLGLPGVCRVRQ